MKRSEQFVERLQTEVLVCDGAMGTELYKRGVSFDHSFDELCLSHPDIVRSVHQDYRDAGAHILLTNSFGGNVYRLATRGHEEHVHAINHAAAQIAREVAGEDRFVAGSIGPLGKRLMPTGKISEDDALKAFSDQMQALVEGGVDAFFMETFSDLREITIAMNAAKTVAPDRPIVAHMTFTDDSKTLHGYKPEEVARTLTDLGATVVGANCSVGPQPIMDVVERMVYKSGVANLKLSIMPNAGLPKIHEGRFVYVCSPEYMADYAREFAQLGCHIVGGCCGTGPEHIRQMRQSVEGMTPAHPTGRKALELDDASLAAPTADSTPSPHQSGLRAKLEAGQFVSSVEIDPPRGIDVEKLIRGAELCRSNNVDCINIADSPLARARMSPMALSNLICSEVDIEIILHMSCRDRNVIGLQSEIMGAYAQGRRNILCVTGDPPQVGDYPNATGVYDVDAIGLVTLCSRLNAGVDLAGRSMKYHTDLFVGVAVNPTAEDVDLEFARFQKKVAAGAHFAMTQPLYELDSLKRFLDTCKPTIPILVGVLPLRNVRHARFLHNEVPGMFIPEHIQERMAAADERGPEEGVLIAQQFLTQAKPLAQGVYLMPPFNQFWMATQVLDGALS
jgi:homocysteine S-methyltransferase